MKELNTVLNTAKRETGHQSTLSQVRKNGEIPAVIYGYNITSTPIAVNERDFLKVLSKNGRNAVFQLDVDGRKVNAVISELQSNARKGNIRHVDFKAINMTEELEVDVPIIVVGEAIGVKDGGVLMQPNREVKIKVKPSDIPESIEIDISDLAIGDSLSVGHLRDTISYEILNEDDTTLVNITSPGTEDEVSVDTHANNTEEVRVEGIES